MSIDSDSRRRARREIMAKNGDRFATRAFKDVKRDSEVKRLRQSPTLEDYTDEFFDDEDLVPFWDEVT